MTIKGTYSFHFRQPALFSIERENLREQLYWSKRHKLITTQGDSVGFPQSAQPVANLSLISKTGFVSVMRLLSFELIERAIQLLLGCQHDAESFLSAEHSVVGEIADDLAQAYAALGMACVFTFCPPGTSPPCVSGHDLGLVWLVLS